MALDPGQIIDAKYRVVRCIGEGGMGTVYEGENSRIGRRVAIKVLHAQVAAMPEFVERFEREARAAARIGSPYVCDVLDLGDLPNGDRYIVMEYLDGVSFEDRIVARGKLTPSQLAPIAFELLEGLGTMHAARVIHRDLKPANVFLSKIAGGRGEVVKILDFGVAKLQPFEGQVGTMTQTGTMMGTPLYMSPEQARGARDVDGRTDIYAASVMFYKALTGHLPYNADTLNELLFKIVLEDPKPLRDLAPEVDEVFAGIVHKGLARDVAQRFETARAYQEAIAAWGRAQGRSSLHFAVTLPDDPLPPPLTPITLPERVGLAPNTANGPNVASAVTNATNGGTPIAWSENVETEKRSLGSEPVIPVPNTMATPVGLQGAAISPATVREGSGSHLAAKPAEGFGQTLASPVPSSPGAASMAKSGPTGDDASRSPVAQVGSGAQSTTVSTSSGSKRGLLAVVGVAVAAMAVGSIIVVARGRDTTTAPPAAAGLVAPASGDLAGQPLPPTTTLPPSTASTETPVVTGDPAPTAPASATVAAPMTTTTAHGIATGGGRRIDPAPKPSATAASSPATTPSAAPPPVATASAKPAASARKFRTNLD